MEPVVAISDHTLIRIMWQHAFAWLPARLVRSYIWLSTSAQLVNRNLRFNPVAVISCSFQFSMDCPA